VGEQKLAESQLVRPTPPVPVNEVERLRALDDLCLLDSPPEEGFDRITRLARHILRAPIALVSLVDANRQWFKSKQGLEANETPREVAFCAHAILSSELFVVPDATQDIRFATNPLVVGPLSIRFYAGRPLRAPSGHLIGTLCIIDHVPRVLEPADRQALEDLATLAEERIEAEATSGRLVRSDVERRRFRTLAECSPVGVFETDATGACIFTNNSWQRITGLSAEESLGTGWVKAIADEDRERVFAAWESAARNNICFEETFRFRRPSGDVRWVHVQAAAVRNKAGEVTSWVGVDEDITDIRETQGALRQSEARFRQLAEATDAVFWIVDAETSETLYLSPAYECVWQRRIEAALKTPHAWLDAIEPRDRQRAQEALDRARTTATPFEVEFRIQLANGTSRHILNRGYPVMGDDGRITRLAGVASDISDLHDAREQLRVLASTDALTGLVNGRTFRELLNHELNRSRRHQTSVAVAYIDVDHFKSVNDTHGHAAGDAAIQHIATHVLQRLRASDVLARMGGDEFCVILPDCEESGAHQKLTELTAAISERPLVLANGASVKLSLSIGIASTKAAALSADELLSRADSFLYEAKRSGRQRVCSGDKGTSIAPGG
jgi:diguanylate cyclase